MLVRIRVRGSPYRALWFGRTGELMSRERMGTTTEILKVRLDDGTVWSLRPDELERLDGEAV